MKISQTFFLAILLILCSCKNNEPVNVVETNFEFYPPLPDTSVVKSQIIKSREAESAFFNLPLLTNGSIDSIEIRVWPAGAFDLFKKAYVFKYTGRKWVGYHYFSNTMPLTDVHAKNMQFSDKEKTGDSTFIVKLLNPVSGWKNFSDTLDYYQLQTLPTQQMINNFRDKLILDGSWVTIEVATRKSYRLLTYSNPSSYEYSECKKVVSFLQFLWQQFGNLHQWSNE